MGANEKAKKQKFIRDLDEKIDQLRKELIEQGKLKKPRT